MTATIYQFPKSRAAVASMQILVAATRPALRSAFSIQEPEAKGMTKDIGAQVVFRDPQTPQQMGIHTIEMVQRDFEGRLCYRVYRIGSAQGCCARPEQLTFLN